MAARLPGEGISTPRSEPEALLYDEIRSRIGARDFETWFRNAPCRFQPPASFVLTAQNRFLRAWLEKNFRDLVTSCATSLLDCEATIDFQTASGPLRDREAAEAEGVARPGDGALSGLPERDGPSPQDLRSASQRTTIPVIGSIGNERAPRLPPGAFCQREARAEPPGQPALNPDCTFENFVVGRSNRVSHAAAIAISDYPGKTYNPLFIHGEPGVGKTHLLHAICHRILSTTRLRVRCAPASELLQELTEASRSPDARAHTRISPFEVLVLDDLQFLPPAEHTQLELLRTFNAFLEQGRQIVLSSRTHPRDTPGLQARVASRFQWGLVTCMEAPGFETRVSILLRKARLRSFELPLDVAELLADRVQDSVRELEGALLRVLSLAAFNKCPPSLELARLALRDLGDDETSHGTITIAHILRAVQEYYQIRPRDLISRSKVRSLVLPRQVGMYLARHLTPLSLDEVGLHFGGRDHTTVLYAEDRISRLRQTDPRLRSDLQALKNRLLRGS